MMAAVGERVQIRVETLTPEWEGVGRLPDGAPVRLDGAVWPGDEVEAVLTARSRQHGHWFARVRRVATPGIEREPFCELAPACGGCPGGGIPYTAQVAWKTAFLRGSFPGAGFVPSPRATGYRDKVKWLVQRARDKSVRTGFYKSGSHRFLPIARCPQLVPELMRLEASLPERLQRAEPFDEAKETGWLRAVFAKANSRGEILVTPVVSRNLSEDETAQLLELMNAPGVVGVTCNLQPARTNRLAGDTERVLAGADCLVEPDWPIPLHMDATGFSQANHAVAKAAVSAIADFFHGVTCPILDLYCGTGPIALALSAAGHDVTGVEIHPKSIELARRSPSSVIWHAADAAAFLADFRPDGPVAVVVNPPRTGLQPSIIRSLNALPVTRLAYMSCNAKTLVRDAALLQECGFRLESATGFDMFPQTPWFETVALFIR